MNAIWLRLACALLCVPFTTPAFAEAIVLGPETLQSRVVTVYQGDLALVHERHRVPLGPGAATLELAPVPEGLMPETARLSGEGVRVGGLRLETAVVSEQALLRAFLGRTIGLVRVKPQTGARTVVQARVLSVEDGVVLQVGDKVETGAAGPFQFDAVPPGMGPAAALSADVMVGADAPGDLAVQYLTTGLGWRADYSVTLSADETMLALDGYVTLESSASVPYPADLVRAVAGDLNRVSAARPGAVRALAMEAAADTAPVSEQAGAYHLYTLPGATTVPARGAVQRALLGLPQLAVRKAYVLEGAAPVRPVRGMTPVRRQAASVVLRFKNPRAEDGGIPLPAGIVRVFGPGVGGPVFLGEDRMGHMPVGAGVRLTLGAAFDVTAERRQADYEKGSSERVYEVAHEIVLRNARPATAVVEVIETLPGDWEILAESAPHARTSASTAAWSLSVPARGETVLQYRALIRQ